VDWMRRNVPPTEVARARGEHRLAGAGQGPGGGRGRPPRARQGEPHDTVFADDDPMDVALDLLEELSRTLRLEGAFLSHAAIQSSEELPLIPSRN